MVGFIISLVLFGLGVFWIAYGSMNVGSNYNDMETAAYTQMLGGIFVIGAFFFALCSAIYYLIV